ncbi:flagellar hook-basal body complex protein FliE [Simiduia agarivorans]|uniref:Flagellar hook-basal body complex protein FliE n=1 Tax=Simiduia agarivorans (strain DSM 21679 / JCM 13881 / BCRC 17597 / SA1) TaxID=1117647 RepID=K4KF66_SIMAS|nr:flagellar hook-basal body complex protein FliE [Simiduia agarivorans]AFU97684.1 flagellar hook-basal body complex protein FliE [Simiduia agarivorans SA1 = DSM 21679]
MVDRVDINRLLVEMRAMKQQTMPTRARELDQVSHALKPGQVINAPESTDNFSHLFSQAIDKVNATQQQANQLAKAYETGRENIDITDVMIASQKASVSFQAMVQVRNKLVEAYRDVMNMPI